MRIFPRRFRPALAPLAALLATATLSSCTQSEQLSCGSGSADGDAQWSLDSMPGGVGELDNEPTLVLGGSDEAPCFIAAHWRVGDWNIGVTNTSTDIRSSDDTIYLSEQATEQVLREVDLGQVEGDCAEATVSISGTLLKTEEFICCHDDPGPGPTFDFIESSVSGVWSVEWSDAACPATGA